MHFRFCSNVNCFCRTFYFQRRTKGSDVVIWLKVSNIKEHSQVPVRHRKIGSSRHYEIGTQVVTRSRSQHSRIHTKSLKTMLHSRTSNAEMQGRKKAVFYPISTDQLYGNNQNKTLMANPLEHEWFLGHLMVPLIRF